MAVSPKIILTFQSFIYLHESLALSINEWKGGILTVKNSLCVLRMREVQFGGIWQQHTARAPGHCANE
jgi:hypothetical protein